jgi:hypothetical protein
VRYRAHPLLVSQSCWVVQTIIMDSARMAGSCVANSTALHRGMPVLPPHEHLQHRGLACQVDCPSGGLTSWLCCRFGPACSCSTCLMPGSALHVTGDSPHAGLTGCTFDRCTAGTHALWFIVIVIAVPDLTLPYNWRPCHRIWFTERICCLFFPGSRCAACHHTVLAWFSQVSCSQAPRQEAGL